MMTLSEETKNKLIQVLEEHFNKNKTLKLTTFIKDENLRQFADETWKKKL